MEYYSESEARELVLKAGLRLKEEKLIARTWGNISARISATEFIITPSGKAYEELTPEDLCKVSIKDLSYEGKYKPSSEKGAHAAAYLLRRNARFVIHTHQFYASAVCAEMEDTPFCPCAKYGLSGTEKLRKNLEAVISENETQKSFLMARHGALCIGDDYDDAFEVTEQLERDCKELFEKRATKKGNNKPWLDDYAQLFDLSGKPHEGEDEEAVELVKKKNRAASRYVVNARPINIFTHLLEHSAYVNKYSKLKEK